MSERPSITVTVEVGDAKVSQRCFFDEAQIRNVREHLELVGNWVVEALRQVADGEVEEWIG